MQRPCQSSDHYDSFSCHRCTHAPQPNPQPSTAPHLQNLRKSSTMELVRTQDQGPNPLSRSHENHKENISGPLEIGLVILSKSNLGYNFIETLNRTLNSLRENSDAAMIFPHLFRAKQCPKTMDLYIEQN